MYFFNEMHTNMEHIAVPHPPQCVLLKHLPPGERYGAAHLCKFQFIGQLRKANQHSDHLCGFHHFRRGHLGFGFFIGSAETLAIPLRVWYN